MKTLHFCTVRAQRRACFFPEALRNLVLLSFRPRRNYLEDFSFGTADASECRLNSRNSDSMCFPSACQCPISDSRSLTQNSSHFCFQLLAAFSYALINVASHSRTVNFEQLIEEFLRIA